MSNYTKSTNFATKDNLTPGDPLKVVRGTEIDTEFNNIATAVATKTDNSAAAITGGSITGITDLAIADGGTGASTATAALNNLLPSQTGNATKYLQTDGSNATWDAVSLSTSDITGTLPVANGGTGVTSSTGTGSVVLSNSPTLVTPALGTPASGVATNLTGLPISTGVSGLGSGVATFLGTPSSANLASAVSDETGSGALVFATSPTLVTPALGTPSALVGTNITGTASGLTAGNVTTNANLTGAVTSVGNATSLGSFSSANLLGALTDETGTGSAVFATSPTLVTPILGTPTSATLTNATGLPLTTGVTGTLPTANGGTGLTSFTSGGVVYASSTSALATGSALTFDGTNLGVGTSSVTLFGGGYRGEEIKGTNGSSLYFSDTGGVASSAFAAWAGAGQFILGTTADYPIAFRVNSAETLRLTSTSLYTASGINVGIGTSSTSGTRLNVFDAGGNVKLLSFGTSSSGTGSQYGTWTNTGAYTLWGIESSTAGGTFAGSLAYSSVWGTNNATAMHFSPNNVVAMTLVNGGNVGIGTSSPAVKLDVVGGIRSVTASTAANTVRIGNTGVSFFLGADSSTGGSNILGSVAYATTLATNTTLQISTNNGASVQATLDTAGNLGLGVTPSAWGTANSERALQLTGGSLWSYSSFGLGLLNNAFYDSTGAYKYRNNGFATHYFLSSSNGAHAWFNAPSGTAGNAISFTQAMTLTAAGQLVVGTTAPYGSEKGSFYSSGTGLSVWGNSSNGGTMTIGEVAAYQGKISYTGVDQTTLYVDNTYNDNLASVRVRVKTSGTAVTAGYFNAYGMGLGVAPSSGTGITFPATQSASSDANTLDDYEEGTWTPSIGGTATYTVQTGTYTKIGRQVTVLAFITINTIGTGSTGSISGLPFTVGSQNGGGSIGYFSNPATNSTWQTVSPDTGLTSLSVYWLATASTAPNNATGWFKSGTTTYFSATYFV